VLQDILALRIRFPDAVSHRPGSRYPAQPYRNGHGAGRSRVGSERRQTPR
jgi:hypothetical protein